MTVLLDTNVIMDALQERSPFDIEAKEILKRSQGGKEFLCLFTANAAADIFYMYSKARDIKSANAALDFLLSNYGVVPVTHNDCKAAVALYNPDCKNTYKSIEDFEDALVVICAQNAAVDYIVTRDAGLLGTNMNLKVITPKKFVALLL